LRSDPPIRDIRVSVFYDVCMRVLEEPFVTRDTVLAILQPGRPTTESPFRTLRQRSCASDGLRIDVRTAYGQLLGRTQAYSTLNADAARALRLHEPTLAQQLAARARDLERSSAAGIIRDAMQRIATSMPSDPLGSAAPIALQRYLRLRARSSWQGLDQQALARDWLVQSAAWLGHDEQGDVVKAVLELARSAQEARADLLTDGVQPVSTFFGVVRRMDAIAAEIEGDDGTRLLPRDELDRRGLATVGQAVALLCEALPAGGTLVFAMPAVALEGPAVPEPGPWDVEEMDDGGTPASLLDARDQAWLDRELAREPTVVPAAPLRRA
jgi:hypothetical protein